MEVERPMYLSTFCLSSNTSKSICRLRSSLHSLTSFSILRVACSSCASSCATCFSLTVSANLVLQTLSYSFCLRRASISLLSAPSSYLCFWIRVRLCRHYSWRQLFSRARAFDFCSSASICWWKLASVCLTRWSICWESRWVASSFCYRDLQQSSSYSKWELSSMYLASRMLFSSSRSRLTCCNACTCPCRTATSCWFSPSLPLSSRLISMSLLICLTAFSYRPCGVSLEMLESPDSPTELIPYPFINDIEYKLSITPGLISTPNPNLPIRTLLPFPVHDL